MIGFSQYKTQIVMLSLDTDCKILSNLEIVPESHVQGPKKGVFQTAKIFPHLQNYTVSIIANVNHILK